MIDMCDCFYKKCKDCDKEFFIHISNFAYGRNDFDLYCSECRVKEDVGISKIHTILRYQDPTIEKYGIGIAYNKRPPCNEGYSVIELNDGNGYISWMNWEKIHKELKECHQCSLYPCDENSYNNCKQFKR